MTDKRSKIIAIGSISLVALAVFATYYRFMVSKDYIVEYQEDCDPMTERCFVWHCTPDAEDESERCTGDEDEDTWYYKLSFRKASRVPLCDPNEDEDCQPMACEEGEKDCYDVFCSEEAKAKYEQEADCSDPEEYAKDHPEEEEDSDADSSDEEECAPDDQECLDAQDDEDGTDEEGESEADVDVNADSASDDSDAADSGDAAGDAYETCQPGVDQECLDDDAAAKKTEANDPEVGTGESESVSE